VHYGCSLDHSGFGAYMSTDQRHGVRCCSIDGDTCTTDWNCKSETQLTFQQAKDHCANQGKRICTQSELESDMCCGTGGNCDRHTVWSSTSSGLNIGEFCALELDTCECNGEVRYGTDGKFSDPKRVRGSVECSSDVLDDPIWWKVKSCYCVEIEEPECGANGNNFGKEYLQTVAGSSCECADACEEDPKCKAWTYIPVGTFPKIMNGNDCSFREYFGKTIDNCKGKCRSGKIQGGGCPSTCNTCKSGAIDLVGGTCHAWCSKHGYCGDSDVHQSGGTDCSGCAPITSCPSTCNTCKSGAIDLVDGTCHAWCSKYGYCGDSDTHQSGGTDCSGCAAITTAEWAMSSLSQFTNMELPNTVTYAFAAVGFLSVLYVGAKHGSKAFSQGDYVDV